MANIRSFKELRVWQNSMDLAMRVFEISKTFPPAEKYSLTDQFRRASRSVASNIAEELALELDNRCEEILGQLVSMASRPDEWSIR